MEIIIIMKEKFPPLILILAVLISLITGCRKNEKPLDPVVDIDGNIYKTVNINNKIWITENLRTTSYNDGVNIPLTTDADKWNNLKSDGFCWYNNDDSYKDTYGAIYNGYAIVKGNLCPDGWHIPSVDEWRELSSALGDSTIAGGKMKEAGADHWLSPNKGADNSSGFDGLPSGIRYFEGTFSSIQTYTAIWSSTETSDDNLWSAGLYYADSGLSLNHKNKRYGFSVRCIKNY
jgi:uncharacterized protein (TIGR02145 family)